MEYVQTKNIKPVPGCGCYPLARDMDAAGAKKIREEIDQWTDKMNVSMAMWRKFSVSYWAAFVRPPRYVVKNLILWACDESEGV